MCGDGTNDVGALKHAHVGVSILSNASIDKKKKPVENVGSGGAIENAKPIVPAGGGGGGRGVAARNVSNGPATLAERRMTPAERARQQREQLTNQYIQKALKDIDDEQPQIVKLGDASIAAPFTSKLSSIQSGAYTFLLQLFDSFECFFFNST